MAPHSEVENTTEDTLNDVCDHAGQKTGKPDLQVPDETSENQEFTGHNPVNKKKKKSRKPASKRGMVRKTCSIAAVLS